jgi:hypothetical protein
VNPDPKFRPGRMYRIGVDAVLEFVRGDVRNDMFPAPGLDHGPGPGRRRGG